MIRGYISLCLPPTLVILLPCCKHDALRNTVQACHHLWSCGWSCQNLLLSSTVHSPVINCTYLFSFLLLFSSFSHFFFLCEKFVIVKFKDTSHQLADTACVCPSWHASIYFVHPILSICYFALTFACTALHGANPSWQSRRSPGKWIKFQVWE